MYKTPKGKTHVSYNLGTALIDRIEKTREELGSMFSYDGTTPNKTEWIGLLISTGLRTLIDRSDRHETPHQSNNSTSIVSKSSINRVQPTPAPGYDVASTDDSTAEEREQEQRQRQAEIEQHERGDFS